MPGATLALAAFLAQAAVGNADYVGLHIPPDVGRRLQAPERPAAQLLADGTDPVVLMAAACRFTQIPLN